MLPPLSFSHSSPYQRISPTTYLSFSYSPSLLTLSPSFAIPLSSQPISIFHSPLSILLYCSDFCLYTFSPSGISLSLPIYLGELHWIQASMNGENIVAVDTEGVMRVYRRENGKIDEVMWLGLENIILGNGEKMDRVVKKKEGEKFKEKDIEKQKNKENGQLTNEQVGKDNIGIIGLQQDTIQLRVFDFVEVSNNGQEILIQFANKKKFILNVDKKQWKQLDVDFFDVQQNIKKQDEKEEEQQCKKQKIYPLPSVTAPSSFISTLYSPPASLSPLLQLQLNLLFYLKHHPPPPIQKILTSFKLYIKQLVELRLDARLREVILKYVVGEKNAEKRKAMARVVKGLESGVVQEFVELDMMG